ncbi:amino acid adenylation enzyme/thioester reductase family protein [Cylindrospermum stagnale PCC 7417]|uniref:Amino acid adenylation enzyme/thioester reductase family protein n=1 Tax=Cylindrospermum stagnale PCC 7417 TaxID=56107 RepID=K9WVI7_9NOST|nr:non-ribosomal peptide synthetase [Cylindrospermum stagnale]AFZ23801.1 amino acid adenylation enzyme/thioester reductase family protein [Cylindrospermum stagnale PCC 7417]
MNQLINGNDMEEISRNVSTIVELLRYRGLHQPNNQAFTFLQDGETQETILTYLELDRRSRAVASQLQALGLSGERALLLYPPGLEYLAAFFGCLYAGVVAVPAYPPRNQRNTPRILAILNDAQAAVILTTTAISSQVQSLFEDKFNINNIHWLTTDNLTAGIEAAWQEPFINQDTLAFLQYTSGSTCTPKGVMLSHGNLLHNAAVTRQYMEHSPSSKFVTWLPVYHDMGLIGGVLQPLYSSFPCIMMPPATFLQRPYRWLEIISRYRGTTSGAPNFAYELCIEKITTEQRATLDLSSWSVAFNGAEPIRNETLARFADTFAESGFRPEAFYPCYGMAEATLMVSGSVKSALVTTKNFQKNALERNHVIDTANEENSVALVGCGRVVPQQQIVIANPETLTSCATNEVGEIWVSGPSIGSGYWNRPEETEQTFGAYLQDTEAGPFLRTGDLGFLHNDELFITGRVKDLIIIRGRNLYPQDLELTAERSHKMLRSGSGAAFAVEVEKEERLVVVQELDFRAKPNIEQVIGAIRQAVAEEHEVQVYAVVLIKAGTIPKTSSGKIQRRSTKAGFLAGTLDIVGSNILDISQVREAEEILTRAELLAIEPSQQQQLLNSYLQKLITRVLRVTPSQLDYQQPLSHLGLDSLKVFELKNQIEVDFQVGISVADFFDGVSLAELATQILEQVNNNLPCKSLPISKTTTSQDPLSFTQQQLWFINQLRPGTPAYNIAVAVHLKKQLNVSALVLSLNEIIQRHQILRTSFEIVAGEPVQKVADVVKLTLPEVDLRHFPDEQQQSELQKLSQQAAKISFDLAQAPLLQVKLLHLPAESILLLTLHHLVADGWSIKILVEELSAIYQAFADEKPSPLPELPVQYTDFVNWQRNRLQGGVLEKHLAYWKQQLSGNLPVLQLPTDRPRPPIQTFRGAQQKFVLSKTLTEAIKQISQQESVTLFMTLLAAFQTLLYRYTGEEDIIIGSPIANRNRVEIEKLIGCFVNTLVLRTNLDGNPSFKELLLRVRQVAIEAYTHQDLPFEKLVEELKPNRDLSYNPLFQVMFVLQNSVSDGIWKTEEMDTETAKFDAFLSMVDSEAGLVGTLEYNIDLFNAETIKRMVGHFQTLLEGIVANSNQRISNLPLLTSAERQTLLVDWNNTKVDFPQAACIHQLFEAQVEKTPDAVAVVFENQKLTYRELNQRSNKLAHYLQSSGVKPEILVGICMERSVEMVVGILAIMKAGGAYLPLDPTYPQQRLAFMLKDAQVSLLLVQPHLVDELPPHQAQVISVNSNFAAFSDYSQNNPTTNIQLENIAYVIYTSGSTGKPKGAINTHQGLCNRLLWMQDTYQLTPNDRVLQKTPFSFDVSVWEFFWPLFTGATLVLAKPGGHQDASYLVQLITQEQITTLHFVPSMLQVFLEEIEVDKCHSIKRIICSGEALSLELKEHFFERLQAELYNLYGPTEAAIDVTSWCCKPDKKETIVPIGRPIANTQIYVLDRHLQPVPVGIPGELHIGGVGLARGYLNRPELTHEKFIPHPFNSEKRLYKTGDLARYRVDGSIDFLGRIDHQAKVRGFRIELGEIEAVLAQHPNVRDTVVIASENRLIAYVVPEQKTASSVNELRHFLKVNLPEYMIPSAFVFLEALPLNPNGKLDRRALPTPENLRPELTATYQSPQSEIEKTIANMWQDLLHLEKVGVNDNFFDIGGHSLLVVQLNNKLREILKRDLSVVEIFQNPTIKSLAQHLGKKPDNVPAFKSMRERTQKQIEAINKQQLLHKQRKKL